MLGPIDYVAVSFEGNNFNGEILKELGKLVDSGMIRVVDLLFITKDDSGDVAVLEVSDLPDEVVSIWKDDKDLIGLLSQDDALEIAKDIDNNCSAGLIVIEQLWAKDLKKAIVDANGTLIEEGRIHPEIVEEAEAEIKSK